MSREIGFALAPTERLTEATICRSTGETVRQVADYMVSLDLALRQRLQDRERGASISDPVTPLVAPSAGVRNEAQSWVRSASEASDPRPLRILLVEDQPVNRLAVQFLLASFDVDLDMAADGAEGLRRFQSGRFDLVLMDIDMPVMDGLTATRAIRDFEREHDARPTPIAMLTAHGTADYRVAAQAAGADAHLSKPVDPDQLCAFIDDVIRAGN